MKNYFNYIVIVLFIALSSCKKESEIELENPTTGFTKLGETYAKGASMKLELWATNALSTGYNQMYLRAYDSLTNNLLNNGLFKIQPLMVMKMDSHNMSHSAPSENPELTISENGLFPVSAVFTMPSTGDTGQWSLSIEAQKSEGSKTGKATFPITVISSNPSRVKSLKTINGTNFIISYLSPMKPKVGNNEIEFVVYYKEDMMNYPAAGDFTIKVTPEMPSMGHGSPNNINPVHVGNGHYKGTVNFTMTGDWRINLELTAKGETTNTYFDINF